MKIEQLQQLVRIVKTGSITNAAKELYLEDDDLRNSIKNLEEELGAPILETNTGEAILTPFGLDIYRQSKDICQRLDLLQVTAKQAEMPSLSVTNMYCSIANQAFTDIYKQHYKEGFVGRLEEALLPETIGQVSSGQSEVGIVTLFSDSENISLRLIDEKDLEFNQIVKRRLYAIVGPENPLYEDERPWINLADLKDYPYITNYASPSDYAWEKALGGRRHKRAEIQVNDLGCALQLIDRTNAVMIDTYDQAAYQSLYAGNQCKFILIKDAPLTCRLGWIKLKNRKLSPICEEFLRVLTEKAETSTL